MLVRHPRERQCLNERAAPTELVTQLFDISVATLHAGEFAKPYPCLADFRGLCRRQDGGAAAFGGLDAHNSVARQAL